MVSRWLYKSTPVSTDFDIELNGANSALNSSFDDRQTNLRATLHITNQNDNNNLDYLRYLRNLRIIHYFPPITMFWIEKLMLIIDFFQVCFSYIFILLIKKNRYFLYYGSPLNLGIYLIFGLYILVHSYILISIYFLVQIWVRY